MSDDLPTLRIIRPAAIGSAELTASNVVEVPPAAYDGATVYALAAQASVFSGVSNTVADVYQSLVGANTGHAPASSPTFWRWVGQTYKEFVLGGPLGAGYGSTARVISAASHLVYESLVNANTGDLIDTTKWAEVGPTNKWAMFDQTVSTASAAGRQIAVTVAPAGRVTSVALFGLDAASVTIVSAVAGYNETYSLVETSGIDDYYDWFFEPIARRDRLVVNDIPPFLSQSIAITIDNGTGVASVGTLVVGQAYELGMPLSDADAGIVDYSKIELNDWGDYTLTPRKYSDRFSCRLVVENSQVDAVKRMLTSYRATGIVWQATDEFDATTLFGIFRSFSIAIVEGDHSICSLELEGIT